MRNHAEVLLRITSGGRHIEVILDCGLLNDEELKSIGIVGGNLDVRKYETPYVFENLTAEHPDVARIIETSTPYVDRGDAERLYKIDHENLKILIEVNRL